MLDFFGERTMTRTRINAVAALFTAVLIAASPAMAHDYEGERFHRFYGHDHFDHRFGLPRIVTRSFFAVAPIFGPPIVYRAPIYPAPIYPAPAYPAPAYVAPLVPIAPPPPVIVAAPPPGLYVPLH